MTPRPTPRLSPSKQGDFPPLGPRKKKIRAATDQRMAARWVAEMKKERKVGRNEERREGG